MFNNPNFNANNVNPMGNPLMDLKHGTTTVAVKYKDGVIACADSRASMGYMVASPRAKKVHLINKYHALTIAGLVADAQYLIKLLRAESRIYELENRIKMSSEMIANLLARVLYGQYRSFFPYYVGLILVGYDDEGGHVYSYDPSGALSDDPFTSTGSGSVFALGVLEANYKEDLTEEEAKRIALTALSSAIKRDIATGDSMTAVIIDKDGARFLEKEEIKKAVGDNYPFKD